MKCHYLKPFTSDNIKPGIIITCGIERSFNKLDVSYSLSGDISELIIPTATGLPERRNSIWEETCFEFFICRRDSGSYWEFNFSPSGHWNVYRFSSYREGMQEEPAFTSLPFNVSNKPEPLFLSLEFDLNKIKLADDILYAGLSAVIKHKDGSMTYWSLAHPGERADFHLRESFIIEL